MSNFYVGQPLWAIDECIINNNPKNKALVVGQKYVIHNVSYPFISVDTKENKDHFFSFEMVSKYFSLQPINQPKTVLTEWQRKGLISCPWMKNKFIMDDIERILSEPDQPKYQPNENEPVLFMSGGCWFAGIFLGMSDTLYLVTYGGLKHRFEKVFPFNADLIGKITD